MAENSDFRRDLLMHLLREHINSDMITDLNVLGYRYLSPTRYIESSVDSLFVSTTTCMEVVLRLLNIRVPSWDNGKYYLDICDGMDTFWKRHSIGEGGSVSVVSMESVMQFVIDYGFKVSSLCKKICGVDRLARFNDEAIRCRIKSFSSLNESEVLRRAGNYPIIATVVPYFSIQTCTQVVYGGPHEFEVMNKGLFKTTHAVLVIGRAKIEGRTYLIVQSRWRKKKDSGVRLILFDCVNIFASFVLLKIDPENFPYRLTENGAEFVDRHFRKRRRVDGNLA